MPQFGETVYDDRRAEKVHGLIRESRIICRWENGCRYENDVEN